MTVKSMVNLISSHSAPNHTLLFTFIAPHQAITTDMLYDLCCDCGLVLKIVIFRNHGVQAIVKFDSVMSATKAKAWLSEEYILDRYCILSVEYFKKTRTKIWSNSQLTYTNPILDDESGCQGHAKTDRECPTNSETHSGNNNQPGDSQPVCQSLSPVIIVNGLNPKQTNADRLFNLFCLYGNVERVKFLKSYPGSALVEMGHFSYAQRIISYFNHAVLFGHQLSISASKDHNVYPGHKFKLMDGTSSFKDFYRNQNNRFTTPQQAAMNDIVQPSNVLLFCNAKPNISRKIFYQIFNELRIKPPTNIKFFRNNKMSGLLEWKTVEDSMEALTIMNHYKMKNHKWPPYPYTLKLSFYSSQ